MLDSPSSLILKVDGLRKQYAGRPQAALEGLSFELMQGRSVAIVGESGSGKSTAALCIAKLIASNAGEVRIGGVDLLSTNASAERSLRRDFGVVLQNPLTALNPRQRLWRSVGEPLEVHERGLNRDQVREKALQMLERVGLSPAMAERFPHELSGGQLQRAVIARSLITAPKLVILDEPTSALDVSVQAQVLNLLCDLRDELRLSYVFITHNLALVEILAHEVLVMYAGRVVERGPVHQVFASPRHPYTAELIAAVPGSGSLAAAAPPGADLAAAAIGGCAFRLRCPRADAVRCSQEQPATLGDSSARSVACHFPL